MLAGTSSRFARLAELTGDHEPQDWGRSGPSAHYPPLRAGGQGLGRPGGRLAQSGRGCLIIAPGGTLAGFGVLRLHGRAGDTDWLKPLGALAEPGLRMVLQSGTVSQRQRALRALGEGESLLGEPRRPPKNAVAGET